MEHFTATRLLGTTGIGSSVLDTVDVFRLSHMLSLLRRLLSLIFGHALALQLPAPPPRLWLDAPPAGYSNDKEMKTSMLPVDSVGLGLVVLTIDFTFVAVWFFVTRTPARFDDSDSTPVADWVVNSISPSLPSNSISPAFFPEPCEIDLANVSPSPSREVSISVDNILAGLNAPLNFSPCRQKRDQRLLGGEALLRLFDDTAATASQEPLVSANGAARSEVLTPLSRSSFITTHYSLSRCEDSLLQASSSSSSGITARLPPLSLSTGGINNTTYSRDLHSVDPTSSSSPNVIYHSLLSVNGTHRHQARTPEPLQDDGQRPQAAGQPFDPEEATAAAQKFAGGLLRDSTSTHLPSIPSLDYANLSVDNIIDPVAGSRGIVMPARALAPTLFQSHRRSSQGVRGPGQMLGFNSSHNDRPSRRRPLSTSNSSRRGSSPATTSRYDRSSTIPAVDGHRCSPRGVRDPGQTLGLIGSTAYDDRGSPTGSGRSAAPPPTSSSTLSERRNAEKQQGPHTTQALLQRIQEHIQRIEDCLEESKKRKREWEAKKQKWEVKRRGRDESKEEDETQRGE